MNKDEGAYLLRLQRLPPQSGEDPICPIIGGHIKFTKHLRSGDSFWIHPELAMSCAAIAHGLHQNVYAFGLA